MSLRGFEPLGEARIGEVCAQRTAESQTLDFKQTLPSSSDRDKSEFLKDVCALANADGGDLVYGIAESKGVAVSPAPITGEAADAAKRRLGQVADAGLEPRVIGLQFRDVPVAGGYVLVVRVPASFSGPHRYNVGGVGRFVIRHGTHTADLSFDQLRSAFDRTATLTERARRLRNERLATISARETWMPMIAGPVCAVHLIPIACMGGGNAIDIAALYNNYTQFIFAGWGGASRSTNLDGLVIHPGIGKDQSEIGAYVQLFRSGAMEAARYGGGLADRSVKLIPSSAVSNFIRDAIEKFLKASREFGFAGPAIAGAALLTVSDYKFALPREHFDNRPSADRESIVLPETWIDAVESTINVDDVARPMLDILWQSFDVERCYQYDGEGNWNARL
jgi:hypothetical protein